MGVDFLKSKQKKFAKAWDAELLAAARRRLFGGGTEIHPSDVVARSIGANVLRDGDEVLVRAEGDRLSIIVDLTPAAILLEPAPAIVSAVRESGGYVHATVQSSDPTLGLLTVRLR